MAEELSIVGSGAAMAAAATDMHMHADIDTHGHANLPSSPLTEGNDQHENDQLSPMSWEPNWEDAPSLDELPAILAVDDSSLALDPPVVVANDEPIDDDDGGSSSSSVNEEDSTSGNEDTTLNEGPVAVVASESVPSLIQLDADEMSSSNKSEDGSMDTIPSKKSTTTVEDHNDDDDDISAYHTATPTLQSVGDIVAAMDAACSHCDARSFFKLLTYDNIMDVLDYVITGKGSSGRGGCGSWEYDWGDNTTADTTNKYFDGDNNSNNNDCCISKPLEYLCGEDALVEEARTTSTTPAKKDKEEDVTKSSTQKVVEEPEEPEEEKDGVHITCSGNII